MGFRFRKSKKIGPVRVSLGKKGISTSIGIKGFRVGLNSKGKVRTTVSIPGTGISYTSTFGDNKRKGHRSSSGRRQTYNNRSNQTTVSTSTVVIILVSFIALMVISFFVAQISAAITVGGKIGWIIALFVLLAISGFIIYKCTIHKSNLPSENGNGVPLSNVNFVVKPQDEAALRNLIEKYTTAEYDQVFSETYHFPPSSASRKYSNSEIRVKAEYIVMQMLYKVSSNRQWVRDSTKADVFFSNYNQLLSVLQSLIEFEPYFPFEKPLPHELLSEYMSNRDGITKMFIERWFESVINAASSLKTVDGKKKRIYKEFDILALYLSDVSGENASLIASKKNLIENMDLDSIEKKEKPAPDFDSVKEQELLNEMSQANDDMALHFCYIALQDFYYKYRKNEKYLNLCIDYCLKDMDLIKKFTNFNGTIPAFKRMAIIEENKKNYDEAINYCNLAIEYYKKHTLPTLQLEFVDRKNKLVDKKAKAFSK